MKGKREKEGGEREGGGGGGEGRRRKRDRQRQKKTKRKRKSKDSWFPRETYTDRQTDTDGQTDRQTNKSGKDWFPALVNYAVVSLPYTQVSPQSRRPCINLHSESSGPGQ